jgi:hypothetical protein
VLKRAPRQVCRHASVNGPVTPISHYVNARLLHFLFQFTAVMYGRPPVGKAFFGVLANGSGSGHVYGLEMRPVAAGPDGERGSNSNHCGALLRAMTVRSVSIPVS